MRKSIAALINAFITAKSQSISESSDTRLNVFRMNASKRLSFTTKQTRIEHSPHGRRMKLGDYVRKIDGCIDDLLEWKFTDYSVILLRIGGILSSSSLKSETMRDERRTLPSRCVSHHCLSQCRFHASFFVRIRGVGASPPRCMMQTASVMPGGVSRALNAAIKSMRSSCARRYRNISADTAASGRRSGARRTRDLYCLRIDV